MLDLDLLTDEDFDLDPDAADLPDLTDELAERPPEHEQGQEEGLGGPGPVPEYVASTADAIALAVGYARSGRPVDPGYCLRETRGYFNVGPLYLAAKDSLAGARELGVAHRVTDPEKVPRGAIPYAVGGSSVYGHIWLSLGGGWSLSTDWPTGRYGKVRIATLFAAWGYDSLWWAPTVNDVRVWRPKREKPKPTPKITRFLHADDDRRRNQLLDELVEHGDGDRPGEVKAAARRLVEDRRAIEKLQKQLDRERRQRATHRQALAGLEVAAR